jgi:multidrug transporter EmrE-like cation transporter
MQFQTYHSRLAIRAASQTIFPTVKHHFISGRKRINSWSRKIALVDVLSATENEGTQQDLELSTIRTTTNETRSVSEKSTERVGLRPTPSVAYLHLAASIGFGVAGQLLMKSAALNSAQNPQGLISLATLLALGVYGLGVVNWILALRNVNLGVAYSVSSLNYVGIFLGSYFLFDEVITVQRLIGVGLIFIGVLLIVFRRRTAPERA